jgi:hypothetical protein
MIQITPHMRILVAVEAASLSSWTSSCVPSCLTNLLVADLGDPDPCATHRAKEDAMRIGYARLSTEDQRGTPCAGALGRARARMGGWRRLATASERKRQCCNSSRARPCQSGNLCRNVAHHHGSRHNRALASPPQWQPARRPFSWLAGWPPRSPRPLPCTSRPRRPDRLST